MCGGGKDGGETRVILDAPDDGDKDNDDEEGDRFDDEEVGDDGSVEDDDLLTD